MLWAQIMTEDGKSINDIVKMFPYEKPKDLMKYVASWKANMEKPFPNGTKKEAVEWLIVEGKTLLQIEKITGESHDSLSKFVGIYHRKMRLRRRGKIPTAYGDPAIRRTQSGVVFGSKTNNRSIWKNG